MKKLTQHDIQNKSDVIHNSEYLILGDYINYDTPILIKHKVCCYEWYVRLGNHFSGKKCPQCAGNAKLTKELFQDKSDEIHNYQYKAIGEYKSADEQIKMKHIMCGFEFYCRVDMHLYNKTGCPKCNGGIKLKLDDAQHNLDIVYNNEYKLIQYNGYDDHSIFLHSCGDEFKTSFNNLINKRTKCTCLHINTKWTQDLFIEKSNELHNSEYRLLSAFKNIETKVTLEHTICGHKWKSLPKKHIYAKQGCPNCNDSIGEKSIKILLNNANIKYTIQMKFDDCKNIKALPFDFYLPDYNVCIEFDGIQHYEAIEWFGGQDALDKNILRDSIKNKYCEEYNIRLYRISYLDNINTRFNQILQEIQSNIKIQ